MSSETAEQAGPGLRLEDLGETASKEQVAAIIEKSKTWLWRHRKIPIFAPSKYGRYSRRHVELIVEVVSGDHDPEQAYRILQAERDAKRARGAVAIAKAEKGRARK